jgi:hypothetical protein
MVPSVGNALLKSRNHRVNLDIDDRAAALPQRANNNDCGSRQRKECIAQRVHHSRRTAGDPALCDVIKFAGLGVPRP